MVLVACALVFYVSLRNSFKLDLGFETEKLSFFEFYMQTVPEDRRKAVAMDLQSQISNIPGVDEVGIGAWGPLTGIGGTRIQTSEFNVLDHPELTRAGWFFALPGYFESLNVPLLRGRMFEEHEVGYPYRVAVINEAMASRFWKNQDAIGKTFYPWGNAGEDAVTVIGICRNYVLRPWKEIEPAFIIPDIRPTNTVHIRSKGSTESISGGISNLIRNPSNEFVADELIPFKSYQKTVFSDTQSALYLISILSIVALMLSTFGTYYITKNFVRSSWKEMCIRMSIGARPWHLVALATSRSFFIVLWGLLLGTVLAVVSIRKLEDTVEGIGNSSLPIVGFSLLIIGLVALGSSLIPSLKLLKLHPGEILKQL